MGLIRELLDARGRGDIAEAFRHSAAVSAARSIGHERAAEQAVPNEIFSPAPPALYQGFMSRLHEGLFRAKAELGDFVEHCSPKTLGTLHTAAEYTAATLFAGGALVAITAPKPAEAEQRVQLVAHLNGMHASVWRSDLFVHNPYDYAIQVTVQGTPHAQSRSQSDPEITLTLQPGETRIEEGVYTRFFPDGGKGMVTITTNDMDGFPVPDPVVRANTYNASGGGEFQSLGEALSLDQFYNHGSVLADTTIKNLNERYNFHVTTLDSGATVRYTLKDTMGAEIDSFTQAYVPNSTTQHVGSPFSRAYAAGDSITAEVLEGDVFITGTPSNNVTSDSRAQPWTKVIQQTAESMAMQYVIHWLPKEDSRFYLSNTEIRAMINGGMGTQSYAQEMAEILFNHSNPQPPGTVEQLEQILRYEVDGNPENGELHTGFDPTNWTQGFGVRFYEGPDGSSVTDFALTQEGQQLFYDLVRGMSKNDKGFLEDNGGFLWRFVKSNPHRYNSDNGSLPDMNHDPTWNWQNMN